MPDILPLLDEIRAIAQNGLAFADNPYDLERYERLMDLASRYYGQALDLPPEDVRARLSSELGYVTAKVGAEAGIVDDEGRILLVQRADDRRWCLPCGWVDPNESAAEAAVRETREETGLDVRVAALVDVFGRTAGSGGQTHSHIAIVYACDVVGGQLRTSHEVVDVKYRHIEDVTEWHNQHRLYAEAAYRWWRHRRTDRLDSRDPV